MFKMGTTLAKSSPSATSDSPKYEHFASLDAQMRENKNMQARINQQAEELSQFLESLSNTPTTPRSRATFRLLQLPRELRDIICEFAITDTKGLRIGDNHELLSSEGVDANPFRLVCWQLYHETRGLLLRLNVIHFIQGETGKCPALQFFEFIELCPLNIQDRIRIMLQGGELNCLEKSFSTLTEYCRVHPGATIKIRFPGWKMDYEHFQALCRSSDYSRHIDEAHEEEAHEEDPSLPKLCCLRWIQPGIILNTFRIVDFDILNLHIYPENEEFDEDEFWSGVDSQEETRTKASKRALWQWIAAARGLTIHGGVILAW